ncbi:MAG TPA: hypothetical protein VF802_08915 [Candidatus Limnocylindrales bacterium]
MAWPAATDGTDGTNGAHRRVRPRSRRELCREEVLGAILLASSGRYSVVIANLPFARALVRELADEADRHDVSLEVEDRGDGRIGLRVSRVGA